MAKFMTPVIQDSPSGWGPCAVPEQFWDMPFSKGDRLGKVADWRGPQEKKYTNYSSQFGGGSQYAYFYEEDERSFQLVDTARTQKTAYQRNQMRFAQRNLHRHKDRRNMVQFNLQTLPKSAKEERERTNSLAEKIPEAIWNEAKMGPEVTETSKTSQLKFAGTGR